MGWQIAQKDGQYRIWSTISDAWLGKWISREEALGVYHEHTLLEFKEKFIREYFTFPQLWTDRATGRRIPLSQEHNDAYDKWMDELVKKRGEAYAQFINETYEKIMRELEKLE